MRLGLDLIGLDDHVSRIDVARLVGRYRGRQLTPGDARRHPLGLDRLPFGLRRLGIVAGRDMTSSAENYTMKPGFGRVSSQETQVILG